MLLFDVARLYYIENMDQKEIGQKLSISRSQISRYLNKAREAGIVEIKVNPPVSEELDMLSVSLKKRLSLKQAFVAPSSSNIEEEMINSLGLFAAHVFEGTCSSFHKVGIGWGRTLHSVSQFLNNQPGTSKITFVPLIGGLGINHPWYQVNLIMNNFALKFRGTPLFFNLPAFVENIQAFHSAGFSETIEEFQSHWNTLDCAIIGLGGPLMYSSIFQRELVESYQKEIIKTSAVGDVMGRFFNEEGNFICEEIQEKIVGISIETLKKVPQVFAVTGGKNKIKAIICGAKLKLFNVLITDKDSALSILES